MSKQILRDSLAVRRLLEVNPSDLKDDVIAINRVTKVVKGGKNLSFSALVVVGDSHGHAGFGMGKAREVPMAIKKAIEQAKKNLIKLNMKGSTIPHQVLGRYGSAQVLLKPAPEGTGVIAGGPVRKVMQVAGIHNVLTKSSGHLEPAQRGESHLRGFARPERRSASRRDALENSRRNQRPLCRKRPEARTTNGQHKKKSGARAQRQKIRRHAQDQVGSQFHQLHR